MEWWRCKHGAPYDPKWRAVAARAGAGVRPGDVWAVFTALCDRASQADDRGSLDGFDAEDVAAGLGYELAQVEAITGALKARGLIDDERVTTWEKHQPKREDDGATQRKRDQRARERDHEPSQPASHDVTPSHDREEKTRLDTDSEKKEPEVERSQARDAPSKPKPECFTGTPKPKTPRATRWPPDAVVPDDWLELGWRRREAASLPPIDLRLEAEKFANHWASRAGGAAAHIDWQKTWVNWCLKAYENGSRASGKSTHPLGVFGAIYEKESALGGAPEDELEAVTPGHH